MGEEIRTQLINDGVDIAKDIPAITTTITIGQADALALAAATYREVKNIGFWVPLIAFIFLVGGALFARHRGAGGIGLGVGLGFAQKAALHSDVSPSVIVAVYDDIFAKLFSVAEVLMLLPIHIWAIIGITILVFLVWWLVAILGTSVDDSGEEVVEEVIEELPENGGIVEFSEETTV